LSNSGQNHIWINSVLKNLHDPNCAGLKILSINHVVSTYRNFNGAALDRAVEATTTLIPSKNEINRTVEELNLRWVTFIHEDSVELLCNLRGLKRLSMKFSDHGFLDVLDNAAPDHWGRVLRYCTELQHVCVHHRGDSSTQPHRMFLSILNAVCGHGALQYLTLKSNRGVPCFPGGRLRLLIPPILHDSTSCLRELSLGHMEPQGELAYGLAMGLRDNKTLQKLYLNLTKMEPKNFHIIIQSLFHNQTLQHFGTAFHQGPPHVTYDIHASRETLERLSRLFRVNKSLYHIALPCLALRGSGGRNLRLLVQGLVKHVKSLDLQNCVTDRNEFLRLVPAFVDDTPLERIILPCLVGLVSSDITDFYGHLAQMLHPRTVGLGVDSFNLWQDYDYYANRKDWMKLLMHAVQENTNICSFGCYDLTLDYWKLRETDIVSMINYNLKLNRCGRRILDSRNVLRSLWPLILVRTTSKPKDADALFFFIREYFTRNSYPLQWQQQQQRQLQGSCLPSPPPKRARMQQSEE
jgi:hypothetical protein